MKTEVFLILLKLLIVLWVHMTHGARNLVCDDETINLCDKSKSWKVSRIDAAGEEIYLSDCTKCDIRRRDWLLLFVSRGSLSNYGKYELAKVRSVNVVDSGCLVKVKRRTSLVANNDSFLVAQRVLHYKKVTLSNNCVLTCDAQTDGLGGVLAFRANTLDIDSTSKIEMSGKGFRGGNGGDFRGGGGYGGETFLYPMQPNMGKGGDISGAPWANNTDGIGGGGGGDGPGSGEGSKGGPGGDNSGGGGGDSTFNTDDGGAGGGGGGHFSGGGGGAGGGGCGGQDSGTGGTAGDLGSFAGGGGASSCPGGEGGNGGEAGGKNSSDCYDPTAQAGNAGSALLGGGGGDSCGSSCGGGGGGGGLQFGNTDFKSRLSYGGGGGGGGGSAFADDPNPGGRGGNGGGLIYLKLKTLTLNGMINANGESGECLNQVAYRSAPGGSGAGGSVVIETKKLNGDPKDKISVSGADPVKCAFGAGGGGGGGVGRWVVMAGHVLHTG